MVLNIVTFNIRCFGFDGDYFGKNRQESRTPFLKAFLNAEFPGTDVFVFQEIMNPLIIDKILPEGFKTYTYPHNFNRHMFIVLACKEGYEVQALQTLPGTQLDDTRSRPAVYGQLIFKENHILDLIGVHLKSKHNHTEERLEQCRTISTFIDKLPEERPKVLLGDFNSHRKENTLKAKDDLFFIKEIFRNQLRLAEHNKPTFLAANETMELDHAFVANAQILNISVYDLPDYADTGSFKKYFKEISDHLPVRLQIQI